MYWGGTNGVLATVDTQEQIEAVLSLNDGEIVSTPGIYTMSLIIQVSVNNGATWTNAGITYNKTYVTNDDPIQSFTYNNDPSVGDPDHNAPKLFSRSAVAAVHTRCRSRVGWDRSGTTSSYRARCREQRGQGCEECWYEVLG